MPTKDELYAFAMDLYENTRVPSCPWLGTGPSCPQALCSWRMTRKCASLCRKGSTVPSQMP